MVGGPRAPCTPPPFTLSELRAAIPAHCWERSDLKSLQHLALNLAVALAFFALTPFINHPSLPAWSAYILWPAYWFAQGNALFGLWVLAHECGHRGFSANVWLCDTVGLILHSFLYVPYHSWRISHAKHHRSTGDADNDEVFRPHTEDEIEEGLPGSLQCFFEIITMFAVGWPLHLFTHVTGRAYPTPVNHFNPNCPLFNKSEYWAVVLSDIGIALNTIFLGALVWKFSFLWLVNVYVLPLAMVNIWLVILTFLQHTDMTLPHFRGEEWQWLRGALCTVDRDYGIFNHLHHHIGDTHVCHHLFSNIPFYHAQEATEALKPVLGEYYRFKNTPILAALWESFMYCRFVSSTDKILWFTHVKTQKTN